MITKRNTYRPHYFGGDSPWESNQSMTLQASNNGTWGSFGELSPTGQLQSTQVVSPYSNIPNLTVDPNQGSTNNGDSAIIGGNSGSDMNWGNVGWGVAGGATAALDQIGKSETNPRGYWDLGDPMHYLANGRTSKVGNGFEDTGVAVTKAGISSGNPWVMLAGAGLKVTGDLVNAGWGMKADKEQLARVNQGIGAANNFASNAYSFDTLQDPMTIANANNMYEAGWFNKKKTRKKNEELQNEAMAAQANVYNQFNNNLNNLQQDQMNSMLANYAAFGGPLHTHGSDWTNGITYVDNGGSHESNPYGGVPMGIAQDGQPNLVEEGEVIYELNGSPYVYSKRIKMSKELKDKYKFKGDTFADGALEAQKESEERPNDPISQRGLNAIMMDLANEQEKKRAERAERQAKYAYGGHIFKDGSSLNEGPGKLAYYDGRFYTLGNDGKWYSEDGKYYISNPSERKGMQFYTGKDFEIEEDWRERMSNPYPKQQAASTYTDPLDKRPTINPTGESYSDYINRMHYEAGLTTNPTGYADLSGLPFGNVKGNTMTDMVNSAAGYNATLSKPNTLNLDFINPDNSGTATNTSTSTSKSASTGKGTSTAGKTTGRQLTDSEKKMQEWLFSNPENFELANKAASEWGARNFKDANDIWNVALTGEPGPAYNGIVEAYRKSNKTTREDLVGRPSFKAEYPTPDEEMKAALANSADRFYNTEEGVEARQKAWERANGMAGDVNNPVDNYKTWMRYAPIFGSGFALALDPWINRPDYTNADLVLEAGKSAGNVDFTPIGDYLSYKPYDRLFYANQLAAQQAATRRALLNTTGGNAATARGLLLAADNQGINQMGNLWRQAEEYNEANRQAIAEFNRGTNMFNSEGRLKADIANQGQANVRINAAIEAAKLRALEDDRVAETRSANFTNFLDNLGDLGRENLYYNMVNNNNALYYGQNKKGQSPYKGEGSTNNPVTMPTYTKTGKNGGYLTIKKRKR